MYGLQSYQENQVTTSEVSEDVGDEDPAIFRCGYCEKDGLTNKKYKRSEIKDLSEDEKAIMKFKDNLKVNVLCHKDYKNQITSWKTNQNRKCCNPLKEHESPASKGNFHKMIR